jgi:hypothetical protein
MVGTMNTVLRYDDDDDDNDDDVTSFIEGI